jgi:fructokinase
MNLWYQIPCGYYRAIFILLHMFFKLREVTMIIVAGEILFDMFEDYERVGGAPFNFAYHLKQMGLPVRFFTRVGDDPLGRRILKLLQDNGFAMEDIQIDSEHSTGQVSVALDGHGVPQFDIRTEVAYDYLDLVHMPPIDWFEVRLVYFGTLAQRTAYGFDQWQQFLNGKGPQTKCFCDINLRPPHISEKTVETALYRADILKLNIDELAFIKEQLGREGSPEAFVAWLMKTFQLDLLALTKGEQGSLLFTKHQKVETPLQSPQTIIDTVGAGDAFAAVLAMGWIMGLPLARTANLAAAFAGRICSLSGALPDDGRAYKILRQQIQG